MNIFEILGPIMVGPSSSHTAGAVRIGRMARTLLGENPTEAMIYLHGSFADTGRGHGTDRALVAGLLGMMPSDLRVPDSLRLAQEQGIRISFDTVELREAHPNTAVLKVTGENGRQLGMQACSVGGGRILVTELNGIAVSFTGDFNTLLVQSRDAYGTVAEVTQLLYQSQINIANMSMCRHKRGGDVLMIIETDQRIPPVLLLWLNELSGVLSVTYYDHSLEEDNA